MILLSALGCAPGETGPLADDGGWALIARGDLFPAHADAYAACPIEEAGAFYDNGDALLLETGRCAYFTLEQPSFHDVAPGDEIAFTLAHGTLVGAPGEGHFALALGEDLLFEATVPIPSGSDLQEIRLPAPARAPAGTVLRLHLHNHGDNVWVLQDLRSTAAE